MQAGNDATAGSGKRPADAIGGARVLKRRRPDGAEDRFHDLLAQGGCELSSSTDGCQCQVEDPRKLRRLLEKKLTLNVELRSSFLDGLQEQLSEMPALRAALEPMQVIGATGMAAVCGDSFVRVLLNVAPLQADVAQLLLERLPEFCDPQGEEAELPQLVLGQLRWLDHVADARGLTDKLLEVLTVCPEELKKDAISFLPEIATEDSHQAVIDALGEMMGQDSMYVLPSIEALSNLCLSPEEQARVVQMVLDRFQSADAADLPAVTRFLLQYAAPGPELKQVVSMLRESLHFVSSSDPRLAMPDRKQKGRVLSGSEDPEQRLVEGMKQAMQLNPAAGDAFLKEIKGTTEPQQHRILDLWLLLVMLTLGADRRKAAEAMLRRKFAEGHALSTWLQKAITGHEKVMLVFFPQLLSLSQQLLRSKATAVQQAGVQLYCCMFARFTESYNQQEVLRALHSHLGVQEAAERSAALGVFCQLSEQHTDSLGRYAAFLANMLDHVDGYTDSQVHQVFSVFSELVAGACRRADEGGDGGGGRSRMEDELIIFVRKQLGSTQGQHLRIGIIGTVAMVQRLGTALGDGQQSQADSATGGPTDRLLVSRWAHCADQSPEAFAFLCDELTKGVKRKSIGRRLMRDIANLLGSTLEDTFCCFLEEGQLAAKDAAIGGQRLQSEVWWNLDGGNAPVALRLLPLLAEQLAPGSNSTPLLSLFATVRLTAALEAEQHQSLDLMAALLGCPFNLFSEDLTSPEQFATLPHDQQRCVLLGLWFALNWCRELVNCFSVQQRPDWVSTEQEVSLKLVGRLRCCCQLEALLNALLEHAPPLFSLPALANTLESSMGTSVLVAAKKAGGAKASGKGGKGGKKKKQGVKFEEDAPSPGGSGHGANTSQQTHSGRSNGSVPQASSGSTQAGDPGAPRGVAGTGAGGQLRFEAERWKQRSLLLPALAALEVGAGPHQENFCYGMLPSAAYLLADLHGKLKTVLAAAKRSSCFPGRAVKQQLAAGKCIGALLDLGDISPPQLLQALPAPILFAVRFHLDAAGSILHHEMSEEATEQHDQENFWDLMAAGGTVETTAGLSLDDLSSACMAKLDNSRTAAALSPIAAATRVRSLALDCVRQLVQWPGLTEPANRSFLHSFLAALSKEVKDAKEATTVVAADGEGAADDVTIALRIKNAFVYFRSYMPVMPNDATTDSPDHLHACLLILEALVALHIKFSPETERYLRLRQRMVKAISSGAEAVLMQVKLDSDGKDVLGGRAWKGRSPLLADVVRLRLCHASGDGNNPAAQILELATGHLSQVTKCIKGEEALKGLEHYPSLSGTTLPLWYRVCMEQLQVAWKAVAAGARDAEKHAATMQDDEALAPILQHMQACAAAFAALLKVVKEQPDRAAIHVQAVKSGGEFLDTFEKTRGFWAKLVGRQQEAFKSLASEIQVGTHVLQALCGDAKFRKDTRVTDKVPAVKRAVERFTILVRDLLQGVQGGKSFKTRVVRQRDLSGRVMPSQLYEAEEEEDDEEDDEEAEDDYGAEDDEEMGETQADD
ncbi:Fanconi anemia group D2 protein [Chlorella vulgaris]